jgi:2-dehydro-3-deoxyphosphooctonate aldolase (KDO 8-P synthase)
MILILGPCVIESAAHALHMARSIKDICASLGCDFIFKASFDKANRSTIGGFRGPGISDGLGILAAVKSEVGVRVTSDIHEPWQAEVAAGVLDLIQIPALLSRQTDLIAAAARTGKPLNLKKGQFMAPEDMAHVAEKARVNGAKDIYLTERGTTFGDHNLVVDMRSIPVMRKFGYPVIMDATHAVQRPSAGDRCSAGDPEFIPIIASAAVAAGADGVFLEVHDDPMNAKSDGANSLHLYRLEGVIRKLLNIEEAVCER